METTPAPPRSRWVGVAVAEAVRRGGAGEARPLARPPQHRPEPAPAQPPGGGGGEERLASKPRPLLAQVARERLSDPLPEGNGPVLPALPLPHVEEALAEVEVAQVQAEELPGPQPRPVEDLDHGQVPRRAARGEEPQDLVLVQGAGERPPPRDLDEQAQVLEHPPGPPRPAEERPGGSEHPPRGAPRPPPGPHVAHEAQHGRPGEPSSFEVRAQVAEGVPGEGERPGRPGRGLLAQVLLAEGRWVP